MDTYIVKDLFHYCNISVKGCTQIPRAWIDFYDLTFVLKGQMTYYVNDEKYILKENDAILIKPNSIRERTASIEPVEYVSFNFCLYKDSLINFDTYLKKIISHEIRNIISAFPQNHLSPLFYSKEKLTNLLNYILIEFNNILCFKSSNQHTIDIIKYINEHITEPISLDIISKHIHLTKEYTAHMFKKETNKTITEYINQRKMIIAKELIQSGEMNLNTIAEHLSYKNYNYFSKTFKKYYGIPPKALKK